jgi:hypothetical protein
MKAGGTHSSWFAGLQNVDPVAAAEAHWEATRAQSMLATQVMNAETDEAAAARRDIGRRVGNDEHELFVSCAPAEALLQQFDVLQPEFIAVHDLGCAISRRLLAGVGAVSQRHVQRLVIRRQGYGTALATLQFIEWSVAGSATIRLYTTEIDADTAARHALALALLAHSRLGVVFVGDLPPHALTSALQPLQQAMQQGPWPNRQLLMLPLTAASALASQASQLGAGQGVSVRTTPQVSRPAEAWAFLSGTWNRLREQAGAAGRQWPVLAGVAAPASAPVAGAPVAPAAETAVAAPLAARSHAAAGAAQPESPLPMRPMPVVPGPRARESWPEDRLKDYATRLMKVNGMLGCCIVDTVGHRVLAHAGAAFEPDALRRQAEVLLDGAARCGDALGIAVGTPELALTLDAHHLLLRAVPAHPQRMLIAVLDRQLANLTLARMQIQRLDAEVASPA